MPWLSHKGPPSCLRCPGGPAASLPWPWQRQNRDARQTPGMVGMVGMVGAVRHLSPLQVPSRQILPGDISSVGHSLVSQLPGNDASCGLRQTVRPPLHIPEPRKIAKGNIPRACIIAAVPGNVECLSPRITMAILQAATAHYRSLVSFLGSKKQRAVILQLSNRHGQSHKQLQQGPRCDPDR